MDDDLTNFLEQRLEQLLRAQRLGILPPGDDYEIARIGDTLACRLPGMKEHMRVRVPRCVLLSALPGAGKTTLSMTLAAHGIVRLCPDEEMFRRHGQYGVDFPRGAFKVRERPVLDDLAAELHELLTAGKDIVFDHGLWTPEERLQWRTLVTEAGAEPLMLYMPVPHHERWNRIKARNAKAHVDANSISFSEEDLLRYAGRFIPPVNGEPHVVYDGHPESVLRALGYDDTPAAAPRPRRAG
ncbi:ATP-binding protein [Streptomyces sp. NPDC045470]|uniref:AAA family ATPase n=1 Tax=Streptomyces sp. NPDC045470 TaxID=3155469 RepID=UPI0033D07D85